MNESKNSRASIVAAASTIFGRRGFRATTIRAVASAAGVSPSLVIKIFGTKSALYAEAVATEIPLDSLDLPPARIGEALVRRMVQRRIDGADEPWANPVTKILMAEDPEAERQRLRGVWLDWLADLIQDETETREHATVVACLLAGLAEGIRTLGLASNDNDLQALSDRYAKIVQDVVDRAARD